MSFIHGIFFCFSFVKVCLTKNPKKRPSAERMLFHPFVLAGDLTVRLSLDLLQKVRNPDAAAAAVAAAAAAAGNADEQDEDGVVANVPKRIPSRNTRKQKTNSEINSELIVLLIVS